MTTKNAKMAQKDTFQDCVNRAINIAQVSPCKKSKRGAVIFHSSVMNVLAAGHNHPPRNFLCSEYCHHSCSGGAIHAEMEAIFSLRRNKTLSCKNSDLDILHVELRDNSLVPSDAPSCVECSKHILNENFRGVWLFHESGWCFYPSNKFHALSRQNDQSQT
jgi:deoxycytidylate deaminase